MKRIFIISHNHKIAFMHVSKVGSTTIAKMIIDEEYPTTKDLHDMSIWRYCKTLKPGIFSDVYIDGYKVYCFVRNPFSRVYASFRHFMRGGPNSRLGRKMNGHTEFNDFVKNRLSGIMNNRHFLPMKHFIELAPGSAEIVRYENFNKEMGRIWGSDVCHENAKPEVDYRRKYNNESVDIVKRLYRWDIENLGYEF